MAQALFVSRTAISKWESGREYPGIDSLKEIAGFFEVTLDDLLSGEQLLSAVEAEQKTKASCQQDLIFGLLDVCMAMLLFLPLFSERVGETACAVSLLRLSGYTFYVKRIDLTIAICTTVFGILTLALQGCERKSWL